MKTAWALAFFIVATAAIAIPQKNRAMSAKTTQRPSLGEAMERVYAGEIESVIAEPPGSLEEIQQAALSWRFRYDDAPVKRGARRSRPLDSGPLTITIDRHTDRRRHLLHRHRPLQPSSIRVTLPAARDRSR